MRGIFAQRIGARGGSQAADDLLRRTLRMAEPEAPIPLLCARQKNGKPFLPDYPGFHFSLSHAGSWAVCAVSEYPLGVDLEQLRELRRGVAERWFSASESALLRQMPPEAFFEFWTLKEAAVKATGEGLARGLSRAQVTLESTPVVHLEYFKAFPIGFPDKNYRLSLCLSRADSGWTNAELQVIIIK